MHKNNKDSFLLEETRKIIKESKNLLTELIEREEVNDNKNSNKTLSLTNLKGHQKILTNELQKLNNLEYVIAFVGTMKSGKSMTINAIVGQEILPSREFPMTTLPTLITHKPHQTEPTLTIQKVAPFNKLVKEIQIKLKDHNNLSNLQEIQNLVNKIKSKNINFETKYEGQENISKFLKEINDLMRIAKELDIEPPYNQYTDVDDLPRIEVEFYHLKKHNKVDSTAKLTLLDTPGPDEVKHSEILKKIFQAQLERASAVTLVVDYTKMNNESDADVKKQVKDVANMIGKKHLFVLLNKFDQRNQAKNEKENYEEAKRLIYADILKDKINKDNVFPISSKSAFYANLGLCELDKNGKINLDLAWRKPFGVEVLGEAMWEMLIDNKEMVNKACNIKWEKSFFEEPLNKIITPIHNDASLMALDSSLTKTKDILKKVDKGLSVEKNAYMEDIEKLEENIESVKNEIFNIGQISKDIKGISQIEIKELKEGLKEELKKNIDSLQNEYSLKINEKIKSVYSKRKEDAEYKSSIGEDKEVFGGKIKKEIFDQLDKLEKEGTLELEDKKEAENIKEIFNQLLENEVEYFYVSSEEDLNNKIDNLSSKLNDSIKEKLGSTLHILSEKFGTDFIIDLPQIELVNKNIKNDAQFESFYSSENKTIYKKSKKFYKKFFGWFNTDWGFEEVKVRIYTIKKSELKEKSKTILESLLIEINELIDNTVTDKIDKELNKILEILLTDIEGYRGMQKDVLANRLSMKVDRAEALSIVNHFLSLTQKISKRREVTQNILHKDKKND